MKDKQINIRLSAEEIEHLKRISAHFGGISKWLSQQLRDNQDLACPPMVAVDPGVIEEAEKISEKIEK